MKRIYFSAVILFCMMQLNAATFTLGPTYEIKEENVLQWIERKLDELKNNHVLEKLNQQLQEKINLLKQIIAESENPTPTEFQIPKENTPPSRIPPLGVPTDEIIRSIIEIIKKMKNMPKPKPMPEPEIGYGGR